MTAPADPAASPASSGKDEVKLPGSQESLGTATPEGRHRDDGG